MSKKYSKLMKTDKTILDGVLGGIANYFGINDYFLRILFFSVALLSGTWFVFIAIYVLSCFIMDDYDQHYDNEKNPKKNEKL
jgi:phage shock protein PspC (stress-responsive transcriptional regulator)